MHSIHRHPITSLLSLAVTTLLAVAGCDSAPPRSDAKPAEPKPTTTKPDTKPEAKECPPTDALVTDVKDTGHGYLAGYLEAAQVPNSLAQLPAPPAKGSAALASDEAAAKAAFGLKGTPRFQQAALDASLALPDVTATFSCALGVPISPTDTPNLYRLLNRTLTDFGSAPDSAKVEYKRERPFMLHKESTCTPDQEEGLRKDGSYPSAHTAVGWGWGLVLAEIAPERAEALTNRGRAYGENRMICNAHWQTDVLQGRYMGTVTFAQLHSVPAFRADVAAARKDVADARAKNLPPNRDCAVESAALAVKLPLAL